MPQPTQAKKPTKRELEDIGHTMMTVFETGYASRRRFYLQTFMKGVVAGFGGIIGATIVVALLLWALSLFSTLPVVDEIRQTLESQQS